MYNPHTVLLSEMHRKDEYKVKFSAYSSCCVNRASQGGEVAILTKKNLQVIPLWIPVSENLEAVGVTIKLTNSDTVDGISLYYLNSNRC